MLLVLMLVPMLPMLLLVVMLVLMLPLLYVQPADPFGQWTTDVIKTIFDRIINVVTLARVLEVARARG